MLKDMTLSELRETNGGSGVLDTVLKVFRPLNTIRKTLMLSGSERRCDTCDEPVSNHSLDPTPSHTDDGTLTDFAYMA